ncbi:MAG: hypothetical protein DSZ21_00790 [Tenericutes bacterium]|nr:MAG: hypothetical protein DSZ21_00790 [Mycoplasmatota bacterium]
MLLVLILIAFLVLKDRKKNVLKRKLDNINKMLDKNCATRNNAEIIRIEKIVNANPKYEKQFKEMVKLHIDLDKKTKKIDDEIQELFLNSKSMSKRNIDERVVNLETKTQKLIKKRNKIIKMIETLTYQDEFLKSEFSYYAIIHREIISYYKNRHLLLQSVAPQIDELLKDINDVSTRINIKINEADSATATKLFGEYSELIKKLAYIVDEGPAIHTYITTTIPTQTKNLIELYKNKKSVIAKPSHSNFHALFNDIAINFKEARKSFKKLDIELTKKRLLKIIHYIKHLERLINFEIWSIAFVNKNYNGITTETKTNLKNYVVLKDKVQGMSQSGKKLSVDLINAYEKMVDDAKELDRKSINFRNDIQDKNVPNLTKLQSTRSVVDANRVLIDSLNEMNSQIYLMNIEKSIAINKYKRLESALNSIVANSKTQNIKMSIDELKEHKRITKLMQDISIKISAETIGKDVMKELSSIEKIVADYYKVLSGKIELAIMINNLFNEYAPERVLSDSLNASFNIAEKEYLEGNYAASLNRLLRALEGRNNGR